MKPIEFENELQDLLHKFITKHMEEYPELDDGPIDYWLESFLGFLEQKDVCG